MNNDLVLQIQKIFDNYGRKKITLTQGCRLRNVNMGYFDSYFDVKCSYDASKCGYVFTVKYLPHILSDYHKVYYKSSTIKAGDFIVIKDICEHNGIPDPQKGKGYALEEVDTNEDSGTGIYFLPQEEIENQSA